jgi:hypothetical protein
MTPFMFRSSLDETYRDALEGLVFFNPRQHEAESGITRGIEQYGAPSIVSDAAGIRVVVGQRNDVQCLFALAPARHSLALAGMIVYLRTSKEEIVVLHIAVSERFSRNQRSGLQVLMALVRAVRDVAHRLRGVERLRLLYLHGRQFQIAIKSSRPLAQRSLTAMQSASL